MAGRLEGVPGIDLRTVDPGTEKPWAVSAHSGHMRGHLDGAIKGLLQAPVVWHVWEHKQVNEKRFRDLQRKKEKFGEKEALEQWDETYYAQAQCYMGLLKGKAGKRCNRHYMTVATPGGRQYTSVRTNFSQVAFDIYIEKAKEIIESPVPLPRISSKADYYICKWCHLNEHCHTEEKTAQVNCRTCAHSTVVTDKLGWSIWRCEFHDKKLSVKDQRKGCPKHLFIPELIPWARVHSMDKTNNTIEYATNDKGTRFVNSEHNSWDQPIKHFASKDLQHINATNIDNDDMYLEQMAKFKTASITSVTKFDPLPFDDPIPKV
jgi:hypothetical protein